MYSVKIKQAAAARIAARIAAQGGLRSYPMPKRVALGLAEIDALALAALAALGGGR